MAGKAKTIVEYFAEHERYRCGYCGSKDTNYSHGMWAHSLSIQDYEDLLDRGWRRSGKYVYKPTMDKTCCPQYPIRCDVQNFKLRKSHKKVIKKVNKYLIEGIKPSSDKDETDCDMNESQAQTGSDNDKKSCDTKSVNQSADNISDKPSTSQELNTAEEIQKKNPQPGKGADPDKPQCKKAKQLRKERKQAKLAEKQGETSKESESSKPKTNQQEGKTLEELLDKPNKAENCAHKLEIRLVRSNPRSQAFEDSLQESHNVYHQYQMNVHKDPPDKPTMKQYTRFLIDSPLEEEKGSLPEGYGSFHQQYILDGKIICVGVIDILPHLVSSKYLYYDPAYHFLSLGTYSALREIAFVRELHTHSEEMLYYYMGFYIHSCPKMKYKGQYFPSYILCPETYTWHTVEKCSPLLDQNTYSRFADPSVEDENGVIDLESLIVLYMRQMMTYPIYKMLSKGSNNDEDEVKEYAGFTGKKCYSRMLLFRK